MKGDGLCQFLPYKYPWGCYEDDPIARPPPNPIIQSLSICRVPRHVMFPYVDHVMLDNTDE